MMAEKGLLFFMQNDYCHSYYYLLCGEKATQGPKKQEPKARKERNTNQPMYKGKSPSKQACKCNQIKQQLHSPN